MNQIKQILLNPIASEVVKEIHALYANKNSIYQGLIKDQTQPKDCKEIYSVPLNLQLLAAKNIQIFNENNKVPTNISIIHSIAHIEYNAMKAYLDTISRFFSCLEVSNREEFFYDFLSVADQEATHFETLELFLKKNQFFYGKLPGIDSIREEVAKTTTSLIERIVVIALIQEGKGLDAGPHLLNKLRGFATGSKDKNKEVIAILQKIVDEEIGHVANGVKWYKILTREKTEFERKEILKEIMSKHSIKLTKKTGKMNWKARLKAGFEKSWLDDFDNP